MPKSRNSGKRKRRVGTERATYRRPHTIFNGLRFQFLDVRNTDIHVDYVLHSYLFTFYCALRIAAENLRTPHRDFPPGRSGMRRFRSAIAWVVYNANSVTTRLRR